MRGMSLGSTSSRKRLSLHVFKTGSKRSAILSDGLKDGPQGMAGRAGIVGSQGSAQTRVLCLVPIDLCVPFLSRG